MKVIFIRVFTSPHFYRKRWEDRRNRPVLNLTVVPLIVLFSMSVNSVRTPVGSFLFLKGCGSF